MGADEAGEREGVGVGDKKAPPTYFNNDKVMTIGPVRYIVPFVVRVIGRIHV